MNHYVEVTLLPGVDIGLAFLWEKVFQQIHIGLVEVEKQNRGSIGISFPYYDQGECRIGKKVRLFSEREDDLIKFDAPKRFGRLADYVHFTSVRTVPQKNIKYATYKRYQPPKSNEQLARRKVKREQIKLSEAREYLQNRDVKGEKFPFISMKSQSSGREFQLFISKKLAEEPKAGKFSSYGLSSGESLTVPEFP